ncbi:LIM and cysteine-rich domains protein 1 [Aplochiton taeniatus]
MSVVQQQSPGERVIGGVVRPCLSCKEACPGLQPHPWRRVCVSCGCSLEDHGPHSDAEDDQRMGRLLADSGYAHLTAKVKGGGGLRVYKRNRMIVTVPVVTRKDPTFNTVTYDWAPAGLTQTLAMQYMELVPEARRPVAGTQGALYRRRQLFRQLPRHDQDPMACHSLNTQAQISSMLLFVRSYKEKALGVGLVGLPGEGPALKHATAKLRNGGAKESQHSTAGNEAKESQHSTASNEAKESQHSTASNEAKESQHSTASNEAKESQHSTAINDAKESCNGPEDCIGPNETQHYCSGCGAVAPGSSPVVFAEWAGWGRMWHSSCFVCADCGEELVDLLYFWEGSALLCGRHYCERSRPRCRGCDELIFSEEFQRDANGQAWHDAHYCC